MSRSTDILESIEHNVTTAYEEGDPFMLPLQKKRPEFLVLGLSSLALARFGLIANRPPKLVGSFALRSIIWEREGEDLHTWAVIEEKEKLYAVVADGTILNNITATLGMEPNWAPMK